jgi:hypothetical protein
MRQSGHWTAENLLASELRELLRQQIATVDFQRAADEVRPFLHDSREVALWSADFFLDLTEHHLALDS